MENNLGPPRSREESYNTRLADLLRDRKLRAQPETIHSSGMRPDVEIAMGRSGSNQHLRMLEAKKGTRKSHREAAVKQAAAWLTDPYCEAVVALCYPEDLQPDPEIMESCNQYHFTSIEPDGTPTGWQTGSIDDLANCIRHAEFAGGAKLAHLLAKGVTNFAKGINDAVAEKLADRLNVSSPKNAKKISGLLVLNAMMLHDQLASSHKVLSKKICTLTKLETAARKQAIQKLLQKDWKEILRVNYAPVIEPVQGLLLEYGSHDPRPLLAALQVAQECAPLLHSHQLDFAGPVYHGLVESRNDGSFYTKTSTAILLAELAIPMDWVDDWTDWKAIAKKRICDPACGTGTLLMASQQVLLNRFDDAGGSAADRKQLQKSMIERTLVGLDINPHAIHLAACMLTLAAGNMEYNEMALHCIVHGKDDKGGIQCGSLELLVGDVEVMPLLGFEETEAKSRQQAAQGELEVPARRACPPNSASLVIMNPPYTRGDIRNKQHDNKVAKDLRKRERKIKSKTPDPDHKAAIHPSSVGTFFAPIADRITKDSDGAIAMVTPATSCNNTSGKLERDLLLKKWNIDYVITGHDNAEMAFSGNTDIHESLLVGRRNKGGGGLRRF